MKSSTEIKVGVRTSHFSNTLTILTEVFALEMTHQDGDRDFALFTLSSGHTLEVLGSKSIWHPFTTPPEWEVIIADIRQLRNKNEQNDPLSER